MTSEPTTDAPRDPDRDAPVNPFAPPSSYRSAVHDAGAARDAGAAPADAPRASSEPAAAAAGPRPTGPRPTDARFAPPGAAPTSAAAPAPGATPGLAAPGYAPARQATPGYAPSGPVASGPVASGPVASGPVVSGPSTSSGPGEPPVLGPAPAPTSEAHPPDAPAGEPSPPLDSWGRPQRVRRPRRALGVVWVVPLLLLALLAGAAGGYLGERWLERPRPVDAALPQATGEDVGELTGVAEVAAQVLPSVVAIEVRAADGEGTGSGFVLREDGYILTNNHVVAAGADGGGEIVVVFADGGEEPAEIVGRTTAYDLAVIKVERTGLTPLVLGDSDAVVVGDPVVAIGAPLGLQGTVTTGIVSALNRPVSAGSGQQTAFINAIQTDAAINPGNSGGPLVDATGQVIGINSAIAQRPGATQAAGSIGLGFAIGSNQARRTAEQLIETGVATYPVVGVLLDQRYQGEGVQVSTEAQNGVAPVTADGPADRAGIEPGDVIVAIDGRPVTEDEELIVAIRAKAPGDSVTLTVRTGDEERDVRVVLDETQSAAP
ncbi:trypsin-like peptidase domain-containing protein [Actinotalea solisilvae]|uniref:trypsin-like peptidase domain-containing protein n=1 Tax=Actinotalea solisilvae TaxID=2072922 RepID=UPI0027DB8435|nr:trypsin-like peptidase domain-containing protein [Actinotalea solisilvae]